MVVLHQPTVYHPLCLQALLVHKLYLSRNLFITREASVCQAQLHPLWCFFTGQMHLVHNYSKVLNFNKSYFSSGSTLLDGNPFSLTGKLTTWHPVILMSYIALEQSLIKIVYTTYAALQFIVQFSGQMYLLALPFDSHGSSNQVYQILLNKGCESHQIAANQAACSLVCTASSPHPFVAYTSGCTVNIHCAAHTKEHL